MLLQAQKMEVAVVCLGKMHSLSSSGISEGQREITSLGAHTTLVGC